MANDLYKLLSSDYGAKVYQAGAGVAMSEEDLTEIALSLSESEKLLVTPQEASAAHAMVMLERFGMVTIPTIGMPGSSPSFRIMAFPDGHRLGAGKMAEAVDYAFHRISNMLDEPREIRKTILG